MKTKMTDLREHLFDVLERLKDPDPATPMTIETAKAIVVVSETIIDSARVENDYFATIQEIYPNRKPDGIDPGRSSLFLLQEVNQ